ncbi:MAG: sigma-70 family RNA polymerase sigma factor [Pseudomonadota bacterium]
MTEISQLIERVAMDDRAAFDRLYAATSGKLFGVLVRILKDRAEAEDALQEVYVRIWQNAARYAVSSSSPMSWLVAIARNHAIDRLRARRPVSDGMDVAERIADDGPTPEASALRMSEVERLEACLGELDSEKAIAVRAAYVEGYSYQELADRFGTPLNTMRTWLRRSLQKLKACLDDDGRD